MLQFSKSNWVQFSNSDHEYYLLCVYEVGSKQGRDSGGRFFMKPGVPIYSKKKMRLHKNFAPIV